MAKYVAPHGWILNCNNDLGYVASKLQKHVLDDDIPYNVSKEVLSAVTKINSAIIQLGTASRLLLEADAEESLQAKED